MLLSKSNAASSVPCSPITYTCDVDVPCGVRCSDIFYMLSTPVAGFRALRRHLLTVQSSVVLGCTLVAWE
jgi:hypothetical protein